MKNEKLLNEIKDWFNHYGNKHNTWSRDPIGIFIRTRLNEMDHWKMKRRGKHSKKTHSYLNDIIKQINEKQSVSCKYCGKPECECLS